MFISIEAAPKGVGLYTAKANGYGTYEIGNVPVGEYHIIVVSGKTHRDIRQPVDEYFTSIFTPYVRNWEDNRRKSNTRFQSRFWLYILLILDLVFRLIGFSPAIRVT